ncbi:MAG TPA: right-handed parallel beta-helix repeat-containing protein [candidate division Zixibacteria bacterium]|nr:right-handed parallel beta-helix repeat-containing protein [candidate division Zixibacteria bacterium]
MLKKFLFVFLASLTWCAFAHSQDATAQGSGAHSADLCVRLQSAIDALPAVGGTVDLRSETGQQTCGATVHITGKTVTVLLGPVTWTTTVLPMIQVAGYDKKTKFNLLCDHPLASTLLASRDAKGSAALVQLGDPSGDGQNTNSSWGRVEGCGFDGGGVTDAIAVTGYTAGEFSRLSIYNYAHRGIYLHHAWNTSLRMLNLNRGVRGASAALVLDDASNTVLENSQCYAGRGNGVSCVSLEGMGSSAVSLRNVDCGDDYACAVLPKLEQPVSNFLFEQVYFENQETPVSIGEQGRGQTPVNVIFLGGKVAANPASGEFRIVEVRGAHIRGMTLQHAAFGPGVHGLHLDGNTYYGGKVNRASSFSDCDGDAPCEFTDTGSAR